MAVATLKTFNVLCNNGFNYEYTTTVQAVSAKAARKEFCRIWQGHWKTEDFRVTEVCNKNNG